MARSVSGIDLPLPPKALGPADKGVSSMIEFHAPQLSHLPIHLRWAAPQLVQLKLGEDLLMGLGALKRLRHQEAGFPARYDRIMDARMQPVNRYIPQATSIVT